MRVRVGDFRTRPVDATLIVFVVDVAAVIPAAAAGVGGKFGDEGREKFTGDGETGAYQGNGRFSGAPDDEVESAGAIYGLD